MGKRNKHQTNRTNGLSFQYMHEVLGPWTYCPKRKCSGTMTEILVSYDPKEPPCVEQECTTCGKVIRKPEDVERRRKNRRQRYKKPWQKNANRAYNKRKK